MKKKLQRSKVVINAPAKINVYLKVGRKRKDGFHSIDTLFQDVSLQDQLVLRPQKSGITLRVIPDRRGLAKNNLVEKALRKLKESITEARGVHVTLTKRIPVGAGLGGGSSDAAQALIGGWILWKQPHLSVAAVKRNPPQLLKKLAAELGSDVPFFLRGGRARGRGRGEKLISHRVGSRKWLILVYPRVHVSTPRAYGWVDQDRLKAKQTGVPKRSNSFVNDFEAPVLRRFTKIAEVKRTLLDLGCSPVMLSGSGSAVFGLVSSRRVGQNILRQLKKRPWDSYLVK